MARDAWRDIMHFSRRIAFGPSCVLGVTLSFIFSTQAFAQDQCQFIRDQLATKLNVEVPAGEFLCNEPIVLDHDGQTLRGAGIGKTVLRLADKSNCPLVILGDAKTPAKETHHLTLVGFSLDGNMANQQIECWNGPCDQGGTSFVRNNGVSVRNAHDSLVDDVETHHNRSGGLVTERGTRNLTVQNFESHHNFFDGLAGYETEGSTFRRIHLHHNKYAGISVDLYFSRNHFEDALLDSNGDVGIYARWGVGNTFHRLTVQNSGNHGIYLAHDGGYDRCANGFSFQDITVENNRGFGLWFNDAICNGTTIDAARFLRNTLGCHHLPEGSGVTITNSSCQ
jgi:hypothetical protein